MQPTGFTWTNFQKFYFEFPEVNLALDLSRAWITDDFLAAMAPRLENAFKAMAALEKGAIANPDENRMVGHYWLRNPSLAPTPEIAKEITTTLADIKAFAAKIHSGAIAGAAGKFTRILIIGIGGSALGPQFVAKALGQPGSDKMQPHFFDNTDPDGMERALAEIGADLGRTLAIVISKSGGTPETRNGMLVAKAAYEMAGLDFTKHAVAITGAGSNLDKFASSPAWLTRFPMWDWVGGRTSEISAVGLLPAILQGIDIDKVVAGAAAMDSLTRIPDRSKNPAALLALGWFNAVNGKGERDMVILPYKDRLELFSKYLQQLIMESLGKEKDLSGNTVHQGIAVYGNKGSTDQHAYIQQLRDGVRNFFATFIEVLNDGKSPAATLQVEPNTTCGDYLQGFFLGTREALAANPSITITVRDVSPETIGSLIALYERAVGLYATLVNINAYHQPGVEAGKKAASKVLALQAKILAALKPGSPELSLTDLAESLGESPEATFKVSEHLASNGRIQKTGTTLADRKYSA
jgi:glucose-6-phosphate isomerase